MKKLVVIVALVALAACGSNASNSSGTSAPAGLPITMPYGPSGWFPPLTPILIKHGYAILDASKRPVLTAKGKAMGWKRDANGQYEIPIGVMQIGAATPDPLGEKVATCTPIAEGLGTELPVITKFTTDDPRDSGSFDGNGWGHWDTGDGSNGQDGGIWTFGKTYTCSGQPPER